MWRYMRAAAQWNEYFNWGGQNSQQLKKSAWTKFHHRKVFSLRDFLSGTVLNGVILDAADLVKLTFNWIILRICGIIVQGCSRGIPQYYFERSSSRTPPFQTKSIHYVRIHNMLLIREHSEMFVTAIAAISPYCFVVMKKSSQCQRLDLEWREYDLYRVFVDVNEIVING